MSEDRQNTKMRPGGPGGPGGPRRGPMGGGPMGMGAPVQKAKNFKGSLKRLMGYLRPHRINLLVVVIFAILSTTLTVYAPQEMKLAMNKLQDGYMAKVMLDKMGAGQRKGVAEINKTMADAQKTAVDKITTQMTDAQKTAVDQIDKQMADVQTTADDQIYSQLATVQKTALDQIYKQLGDTQKKIAA